MKIMHSLRRSLTVVSPILLLTLLLSAQAGAAPTTIYSSDPWFCSNLTDTYVVELEVTLPQPGTIYSGYPSSILLHFSDGSMPEVPASNESTTQVKRYVLEDPSGVYQQRDLLWASAYLDIPADASVRFQVTEFPCTSSSPQTSTVSGVIVQHGNLRPIEGLEVCLSGLAGCVFTDANGMFVFTEVTYGNYTLTSDGITFRSLSETVVVDGANETIDLVQRRGGGQ